MLLLLNMSLQGWQKSKLKNSEAPACPQCGEQAYFVVESRKAQGIQRRRRCCKTCGYRATTYEISATDYELLKKARYVETIFGEKDKSLVCQSCSFWGAKGCSFGFPEAGGRFAEECSNYARDPQ
jgi:hypothetical protein